MPPLRRRHTPFLAPFALVSTLAAPALAQSDAPTLDPGALTLPGDDRVPVRVDAEGEHVPVAITSEWTGPIAAHYHVPVYLSRHPVCTTPCTLWVPPAPFTVHIGPEPDPYSQSLSMAAWSHATLRLPHPTLFERSAPALGWAGLVGVGAGLLSLVLGIVTLGDSNNHTASHVAILGGGVSFVGGAIVGIVGLTGTAEFTTGRIHVEGPLEPVDGPPGGPCLAVPHAVSAPAVRF